MTTKKTESHNAFAVSVIFILSSIALILIFVLLMRDQNSESVEDALKQLAQTNVQLQQAQTSQDSKTFEEKISDLYLDPKNLWEKQPCEKEPYCSFIRQTGGEKESSLFVSLNRWDGFYTSYDDGEVSCDQFDLGNGNVMPINMELLASVEQKLLMDSTEKEPIGLTVYQSYSEEHPLPIDQSTSPCLSPAYVLNVHFE